MSRLSKPKPVRVWLKSFPDGLTERPVWVATVNGHRLSVWVQNNWWHWTVVSDVRGLFITGGGRVRTRVSAMKKADTRATSFAPGLLIETQMPSEKLDDPRLGMSEAFNRTNSHPILDEQRKRWTRRVKKDPP